MTSEHAFHAPATAPWLPPGIRARIELEARFGVEVKLSRTERRVLRKRRKLPISQWAEAHRWVRVSSREGQWRNSTTPYLAGIMDAVGLPFVRDVTVCAAPQVGKSEMGLNCLASWIDQDPGPAMIVYADEQTAKDEMDERIEPMISDSPRLSSYKTKALRDVSNYRLVLQHMVIHMAWATSVVRLATKPKRYVIFDEVDKYPESLKKEANPINLGTKRTRTYPDDKKILKISTPTWEAGPIWQSLKKAQRSFRFHVKCPDCGHKQVMVFGTKTSTGGVKWPEDERDPATIETQKLAWYQCEKCEGQWDDHRRDQAVLLGGWRCEKSGRGLMAELQASQPSSIGFHIPAWLSTFVSLSECAAAFLKAQSDKILLKDFMNGYASEPWLEFEVEREEDQILALRDGRFRGLVPGGGAVSCLTAAVDTQDTGFWYEVRAWGYGQMLESWQIREGFVPAAWDKVDPEELEGRQWPYHPAFDTLRQVLWEDTYEDEGGTPYRVRLACIDAMGHKTTEVYAFCRAHKGQILPLQGMKYRGNTLTKFSKIDTYPGTTKKIPGGLTLLQVDVHAFKDSLSSRLQVSPMDPGAWHLHSETSRDWAQHLCAEYRDDKTGKWFCPSGKANHGWDCSVYNLAMAEVLQVRMMRPPVAEQKPKAEQPRTMAAAASNPYLSGRNPYAER